MRRNYSDVLSAELFSLLEAVMGKKTGHGLEVGLPGIFCQLTRIFCPGRPGSDGRCIWFQKCFELGLKYSSALSIP
jgi:hypothetical protein